MIITSLPLYSTESWPMAPNFVTLYLCLSETKSLPRQLFVGYIIKSSDILLSMGAKGKE